MAQKVAIVGLGYVGLPLAVLVAEKGYTVTGLDLDTKKLELLQKKVSPIKEEFIESRLPKVALKVTDDFKVIKDSEIIIVCVPTPVYNDYQPNLEPLKGACRAVAQNLQKGALIIIESTINPGVCDEVLLPLLETESGMKTGSDFYLSHCPERINPGDAKWNVSNIPRVAGSFDKKGLEKTVAFYQSVVDAEIKPMGSLKEAEAVKVVENSFRDVNIAFVNELAMSFDKLGINVVNVINGATTKPFAFIPHYPSIGVGGHCIPVDPYYLIEYAKQSGFDHEFLLLARNINRGMPAFTLERLIDGLNEAGLALSKAKVALLGLSYKANVGDDRESPSYVFLDLLKDKGADVIAFDPFIPEKSDAKNLDESLRGCDAVVIAANHQQFVTAVTPEKVSKSGVRVVIDGKNCLNKTDFENKGIIYRGIGT